ncbi:MAG TPA: GNAT family N-acetyltransferase [Gemmataceae bacterium]|nr:GNAT family N-acetyltransferase [Gemmataceae bacterium]
MKRLRYFKRFRMELDLRLPRPPAALPHGFYWLPWDDALLNTHAEVKVRSFEDHLDTALFPCLGYLAGCRDLMTVIRNKSGFCPAATWLVAGRDGCVATVQGVIDEAGYGGVQNLGVMPDYRGRGIGRALMLKALAGFAAVGSRRAFLDVTASNHAAVKMYRSLGFRAAKTVYRSIELPDPVGAGL